MVWNMVVMVFFTDCNYFIFQPVIARSVATWQSSTCLSPTFLSKIASYLAMNAWGLKPARVNKVQQMYIINLL
jgi:hypothetical protein